MKVLICLLFSLSVFAAGVPSAMYETTVATHTNVTCDTTEAVLLAADTRRKKFTIFNDAGKVIDLKYGTGSSTTSFWLEMADQSVYESELPLWKGVIYVVCGTAGGSIRVTEER